MNTQQLHDELDGIADKVQLVDLTDKVLRRARHLRARRLAALTGGALALAGLVAGSAAVLTGAHPSPAPVLGGPPTTAPATPEPTPLSVGGIEITYLPAGWKLATHDQDQSLNAQGKPRDDYTFTHDGQPPTAAPGSIDPPPYLVIRIGRGVSNDTDLGWLARQLAQNTTRDMTWISINGARAILSDPVGPRPAPGASFIEWVVRPGLSLAVTIYPGSPADDTTLIKIAEGLRG